MGIGSTHWNRFKTFANPVKQVTSSDAVTVQLQVKPRREVAIAFQRFEYQETELYGKKLTECRTPMSFI